MFSVVIFSLLPQVYILMAKRLRELCTPLDIPEELRLKIWTCFEHSLVHFSDLMIDRHLDQLLMCPIYIIAKVGFYICNGHVLNCFLPHRQEKQCQIYVLVFCR